MKKKSLSNIKWILLILFSVVLSNCGFIPCPYYSDLEQLEKLPTDEQLIGDYKLNIRPPNSVGPAELILKQNNTFELKNVPVGVLDVFNADYKQNEKSLQNITGKWKAYSDKDNYELNVTIEYNKIDPQLENIGTSWKLYEQDKKPVILIILGDPDSCEALSFIKK
jgi:hypothetical protein